ncbi:MAG: hypothetical protein HZB81_01285 [Deltaproteobacteria bacterium]|nr:hypothetical protein [Deltaproteobacteria bacterium]
MPSDKQNETTIIDPRYAPPYPQKFHRYWPRHAIKGSIAAVITIAVIAGLAYEFRLPAPVELAGNITLPDDGMYIPGPEWYFLFLLQPFWYLKGELSKWQFIGTALTPGMVVAFILLVPFLFKNKKPLSGIISRLVYMLPPVLVFSMIMAGITYSGYPAKLHGCIACHNPSTGVRQNLPPMDVADFYKNNRQRQIAVGKYRASKTGTEGETVTGQEVETYKDANWQMRHIYEPTFTW